MNVEKLAKLADAHNSMTFDGLLSWRNREPLKSLTISEEFCPLKDKTFYGNLSDELENAFCAIIRKYKNILEKEIKKECNVKESP